ncbi:hypothetical protein BAR24066_02011 [Burkholderia arboris]|uniref:Uncharacterized protein n=1 Tax=Burkholderia arboris TaxID=488730 RepID=A0A9Q9SGT3_9BURK|nr:hypothetical protein BAR24066_02011 [Burkholderia arboris]
MAQHCGPSPAANESVCEHGFIADGQRCDAGQKRVRMPIVPTTWFAVLDAPPDVLMNAW